MLAVASAHQRYSAHHGSGMAPLGRNHWECHGKDVGGKPCGYWVPFGTSVCHACGHAPPFHVTQSKADARKQNAAASKGAGKGVAAGSGRIGGKGSGNAGGSREGSGGAKKLQDAQAELKKLKAELATAKATAAGAKAADAPEAADASDPNTGEQKRVADELAAAREVLIRLESTPPAMEQFLQKPLATLVTAQKVLVQGLEAKKRGLRPVVDQVKQSRARLTNLQARSARETTAVKETQTAIESLQANLAEQVAKATATTAEIDKAKEEITLLSAAAAAEGRGSRCARAQGAAQSCAGAARCRRGTGVGRAHVPGAVEAGGGRGTGRRGSSGCFCVRRARACA